MILNFIRKHFSIFIIIGLFVLVVVSNFRLDTFLSGWDNLHPEFNFLVNIKRSLFAVWQEYQGLGLLGGMGHAADLPRQIFLLLISFILPSPALRYLYHFLMLLAGPLGIYFLLKDIILSGFSTRQRGKAALLGAVFYLFNLATLQMFYVPYEPYSVHFGFMPWLFWAYLNFLKKSDKNNLFLLFLINLLAVPQGYVITFFFIYALSLVFITVPAMFFRKATLKRIVLSLLLIFLINSFWLLPNLYFVFTKVNVNLVSKSNQMTTEDNLLRNKKYGNLENTSILKGFWFDNVEIDKEGISHYQMETWRKYLDMYQVRFIGYLSFAAVLLGIIYSFRKKINEALFFIPLLFLSFTVLSNDAPFFSFLANLFYKIPLFNQIFRFPFTKFSILTAFGFSIFFGISYLALESLFQKRPVNNFLYVVCFSLSIFLLFPVFTGNLFYDKVKAKIPQEYFQAFDFFDKQNNAGRIANFPQYTFWGWTFYRWNYSGSGFLWYGIKQPILDRAFDVWSSEDENYYHEISYALYSRNLNLFESIFDKYQIEWILVDGNVISYASGKTLYLNQFDQLVSNSSKFQPTAQFGKIKIYKVNLNNVSDNFVSLVSNLPSVGPEYKWGSYDKAYEEYGNYVSEVNKKPAFPYRVNADSLTDMHSGASIPDLSDKNITYNTHPVNSGVDLRGVESPLPDLTDQVPHRRRPTQNQVYQDIHGAINQVFAADNPNSSTSEESLRTPSEVSSGALMPDVYYPFRSLFTGRQQSELEFGVKDKGDYFSFTTKIPKELVGYKLVLPQLDSKEVTEINVNDLSQSVQKIPQVFLDGELIQIPPSSNPSTSEESELRKLSLPPSEVSISLPYIREGNLEIRIPKINGYYSSNLQPFAIAQGKPKSCDQFNSDVNKYDQIDIAGERMLQLTSIGSSNCLDFDMPLLSQDLSYLVTVKNKNVEGKSLLFSVINKNSQRADIETYLPKQSTTYNLQPTTSYFILPPMEQYGLGYTLHLDNISIGRETTINDLGKITVNPIPYRFLTGLKVIKSTDQLPITNYQLPINVDHPNPSLYKVNLTNNQQPTTNNQYLVLSQSFDSGWHAYTFNNQQLSIINYLFPFWTGRGIKGHVLVNNWENGWRLQPLTANTQPTTVIIVYLPQYLEYIGFILLGVGILVVIFYPKGDNQTAIPISNPKHYKLT